MPLKVGTAQELSSGRNSGISREKANDNLFAGAKVGSIKTIEMALAEGADINAKNKNGYTALMISISEEDLHSIKFLKEKGADLGVLSVKEGYTALMMAVNRRFTDEARNFEGGEGVCEKIIRILVEGNADTNHVNDATLADGRTALMIALDAAKDIASMILIGSGADVNKLNASGFSSLTYAVNTQDTETIEFLLKNDCGLAINQMWDAVAIALEKRDISLFLKLWSQIQNHPEKFVDIGITPVVPDAVRKIIEPQSSASNSQNANMAMLVANNPGPSAVPRAPKKLVFNRRPVEQNPAVAPQPADAVKRPRPTSLPHYDVEQPVRSQNLTNNMQEDDPAYREVQLPSP